MKKLTLPLSLLAAATLAACAGAQQTQVLGSVESYQVASTGTVTSAVPVRTGKGKVAYLVDKDGPVNGVSTQRVTMHMNDGSMQFLETRGSQLAMGEHIRISQDSNVGRDKFYFHATE